MISLLGERTGQLHMALSSRTDDPSFAPEPFTMLYQRSVYQSMRNLTSRVMQLLRTNIKRLPEDVRKEASRMLDSEQAILHVFQKIMERKISSLKIRYHGDYHLGQVLFTGNDFVIIDFEGEPARSLTERRLKRSPVRDLAGMVRSFHYAAYSVFLKHASVRPEDVGLLEPWIHLWYTCVSGIFLDAYRRTVGKASLVPAERTGMETLFDAFVLEKAVYETGYELNNRPDWVIIPLRGITHILERPSSQ
jgi:maltose alpha-D-glucosyltransferase/alpha-amylase